MLEKGKVDPGRAFILQRPVRSIINYVSRQAGDLHLYQCVKKVKPSYNRGERGRRRVVCACVGPQSRFTFSTHKSFSSFSSHFAAYFLSSRCTSCHAIPARCITSLKNTNKYSSTMESGNSCSCPGASGGIGALDAAAPIKLTIGSNTT